MKKDLLLASNGVRKLAMSIVMLSAVVCCALFSPVIAYAQKAKNVTGKITDARGPMIGVTISVKGMDSRATLSNLDGTYTINVAGVANPVLEFTYVGYEEMSVPVGTRTVVDVVMKEKTQKIDEVIVTALGITRAEKSLGYAVSKVSGDDIAKTVSGNWLDGMNGKVAGMSFESAATGPSGSVRVTLRGESSLSHDNNEALFVVDGVPLGSDNTATGSDNESADAPIDYGNGIGDLNPDDIASVSVLKGPAATALYGSRAQNGAVIITTKSGQKNKGIGITYSLSIVAENASYWPDFQTEYGSGSASLTTKYTNYNTGKQVSPQEYYSAWDVYSGSTKVADRSWNLNAWGPKHGTDFGFRETDPSSPYYGRTDLTYLYKSLDFNKLQDTWYASEGVRRTILEANRDNGYMTAQSDLYTLYPFEAQDYYKGFYKTGMTYKNSIAISGNNGKGTSVRASFQDARNNWIVPNMGYNQESASFSINSKLNKVVKFNAKVNYYRKKSDNLPTTGYNVASPVYQLMGNHPNVSIDSYYDEYKSGRIIEAYANKASNDAANLNSLISNNGSSRRDNVYWLAYDYLNTQTRDRLYGNMQVTFDITKDLSLFVRSGLDMFSDYRTSRKPQYANNYAQGWYRTQNIFRYEVNSDFLLSYKHQFNRFFLGVNFGGNNMVYNYRNTTLTAEKLSTPNVFMMSNSVDRPKVNSTLTEKMINSLYGMISLNYNDTYFLDLTARNDWSSALPKGNNSYFYPSVSASVLLDQAIPGLRDSQWLDMLKIRGSWANVGNDTGAYRIVDYYTNSSYNSSVVLPGTLANANLKPENTASWEIGVEAHLFKKRLSIDVAYYDSKTTNQILDVPTDQITGATYKRINAGEVNNHGVEISLGAKLVQVRNFTWDFNFNWSKNWNRLIELAPGVDLYQLNTGFTSGNNVFIYAYPKGSKNYPNGTELGRIFGYGFKRAPQGAYYIDADGKQVDCAGKVIVDSNGYPQLDTTNLQDFGSIYPDWKGGFSTSFKYKNLRLGMQFTYQYGGKCYSLTHAVLAAAGKTKDTLYGRYDGLVHDGVNVSADGIYTKNTTITQSAALYYQDYVYTRKNSEMNTFDTSFLKLKQISLDYSLGKKAIQKIGWLRSLSVGVFVTNVFCVTDFPQYDPEAATFNSASISRGIETGAYPMTRTYGFTLKLGF